MNIFIFSFSRTVSLHTFNAYFSKKAINELLIILAGSAIQDANLSSFEKSLMRSMLRHGCCRATAGRTLSVATYIGVSPSTSCLDETEAAEKLRITKKEYRTVHKSFTY